MAAAVAVCAADARSQDPLANSPNALADQRWAAATASATLAIDPPKLKNANHWTIESRRHRGAIWSSAQSPDGTRLATGGLDGTVRIWNLETGRLDRALSAYRFAVSSMAWSPDGMKLATVASGGQPVRIWEPTTGKLLAEPMSDGHLHSLVWSPDSRRLAANRPTERSGRIYVSDSLGEFKMVKQEGDQVAAIAWSRDSGLLAYALTGGAVNVVETSNWGFKYSLDMHGEAARALEWSPDGRMLATAGPTGAAVWKSEDGAEMSHTAGAYANLAWAPDSSRFIASASTGVFVNPLDGKAGPTFAVGGRIHWNTKTGRITVVAAESIQVREPDAKKPTVTIDAGGANAPVFLRARPAAATSG